MSGTRYTNGAVLQCFHGYMYSGIGADADSAAAASDFSLSFNLCLSQPFLSFVSVRFVLCPPPSLVFQNTC